MNTATETATATPRSRRLTEGEQHYHAVRIRNLMKDRGISLDALARELGVKRPRVSMILSAKPPAKGREYWRLTNEALLDRVEDALQVIIDREGLEIRGRDTELEDYFSEVMVVGLFNPETFVPNAHGLGSDALSPMVSEDSIELFRKIAGKEPRGEDGPGSKIPPAPRFNRGNPL